MSGFLWVLVGAVVVTALSWFAVYTTDNGVWFAVFAVAAITLVVCAFVAVIMYPSRAVGRVTCRNFSEQTGYPTKFRVLNWSDTGTCLVQTPDGHWTKNTNIIVNVPARSKP